MAVSNLAHRACQAILSRLTLAHLAGSLLLVASGLANFKYGLTLGQNELEKLIAGGASIGADLWNAAGFVLAFAAFRAKRWGEGVLCAVVLAVTLAYSVNAGLGFHSTATIENVDKKTEILNTSDRTSARLAHVEKRLAEIGSTRPTGQIASESAAILSDRRANDCKTMDGPYTKANCPTYFKLQGELALAKERELLVTERNQLAGKLDTVPTVTIADPLNETVRRYLALVGVTVAAADIRPWQTLLFVVLIVVGGPVAWAVAEANRKPVKFRLWAESAANENVPEPTVEEPEEPLVVRPRKVVSITPVSQRALDRLHRAGGTIQAKSQAELATKLGVPRTSFRRVNDMLEGHKLITTEHGPKGYTLRLVA